MVAAMPLPFPPAPPAAGEAQDDQRVTVHGVSWDQYVTINDAFPDSGPRMAYLEGTLEIMTTGRTHERIKKTLARLIEAHADEARVRLVGHGHATFRKRASARGAEPDECYALGRALVEEDEMPDLAIEVIISHGSIDKLAIYAGLGIPEVWFWEEGHITVYCLGPSGYQQSERSKLLPGLDIAELASFSVSTDQVEAVWAYRERLRARAVRRP